MPSVILASGSPRRRELLTMLGLDFEVVPSKAEELAPEGLSPEDTVMFLARTKGEDVAGSVSCGKTVIAADTIVYLEGRIIGKPKDAEEAKEMLRMLSGKTHEVYTGVFVNGQCEYERTSVTFRELTDDEIDGYIATGEPLDKAGAYGAQGLGSVFVSRIEGDFFNVMGLPVCRLSNMLKAQGLRIF